MISKISEGLKKYKNAATSEAKETRLLVKILMSAAKEIGHSGSTHIREVINNKRNKAGGYKWKLEKKVC